MSLLKKVRHQYVKTVKKIPVIYDYSYQIFRVLQRNRKNEDKIYNTLNKKFSQNPKLKVLQIGANDGIRNDPLREFIVKYKKAQVIFVEPIPIIFKELVKNYNYLNYNKRFIFLNVAIGNHDDKVLLWKLKEEAKIKYYDFVQGMVSFNKEHFLKYVKPEKLDQDLESIVVPQKSVRSILAECNYLLPDLVILDVEGYELNILNSYPFDLGKPDTFVYESVNLSEREQEKIEKKLAKNGYSVKRGNHDSIAILNE